ncbi:MAG: methyltransferase [Candidatus Micrarchaeota archaeon]|nr:methyltransferase [Candidatus Micrarchaeota archaeon]
MLIVEGRAKIKTGENTFYNPKMRGLRDISVLFLKASKMTGYSLLDSTCATGVRGIRYILEADAGKCVFLDINKRAYLSARINLRQNKISARILNESIQEFCNTQDESFDAIDLDPFGSAAPYIYDIMKVAKDKTLLMVTATDTAVLCGAEQSACMKTYASQPIHNELCHEGAVRILTNYIARIAAQFNFGISVKLAIANLHYVRVFIVLEHGAKKALDSVRQSGFGEFCSSCRNFALSKGIAPKLGAKCKNCKSPMYIFGPLWLGGMMDKELIREMKIRMPKEMEEGAAKIVGKLDEELDLPFFYSVSKITRQLGIGSVSKESVIKKLSEKHQVSKTHFDLDGIKTDAGIKQVTSAIKWASRE